jgi:predicted alpha/beta hydrolase
MTSGTPRTVTTANGRAIAATMFKPAGEPPSAPRAAVLIVPAMGVPQRFYGALASWLAGEGFAVATFDYFGTYASRVGPMRRVATDVVGWAQEDCHAMVDAAAALAPGHQLFWLGHSLGGQILGFIPDLHRISKMVTIATGSGYWVENAAAIKWQAWALWHIVAPPLTGLFGYFPGGRLGMVGDLPKGVITQWRRWCLDPEYAVGAEGPDVRARFAAVSLPITSISFTDDEMMSAANTTSLHGFYAGAPRVMKRLSPSDVGVPRIGHFGFFKPTFEPTLWRPHLLPELA